jgi:hypothetical protein
MLEKRSSKRRLISRYAKLQVLGASLARDCLITDISEGGVRLHLEGMDVPDQFVLVFSTDGGKQESRHCKIVWKLGNEFGAKFYDTGGRT